MWIVCPMAISRKGTFAEAAAANHFERKWGARLLTLSAMHFMCGKSQPNGGNIAKKQANKKVATMATWPLLFAFDWKAKNGRGENGGRPNLDL